MVEDRGKRGVGPLVVRPDSGDPPTVVCKVLDILGTTGCMCVCSSYHSIVGIFQGVRNS